MYSVTQILDYFQPRPLVDWKLRMGKTKCERISKEALNIGSMVDKLVQEDVTKGTFEIPKDAPVQVSNCMAGWCAFKDKHGTLVSKIKRLQAELIHYDVLGHPDIIIEDDDFIEILDIKTSKSIRETYWVQTGQYMWMEMNTRPYELKKKDKFISILRLDKEVAGKFQYERLGQDVIEYAHDTFSRFYFLYTMPNQFREYLRLKKEEGFLDVP